ncbi:MAG: hypothetical protein KDI88_19400, partial [Gammaproteobacteria bacterium]|nr:hypothetical protein [Gammaproteobacteria bacterium]
LNWRNWADDPYHGIDTATLTEQEREKLGYQALLSGLSVSSDPLSSTLNISYHGRIPKQTARTANAFAKAYVKAIKTAANSPDTGTAAIESIRVADARQAVALARTALDQYLQEPQNQARFDQLEADRSQLQLDQTALNTARSELLELEFRQGRAQRIDIRFTDPGEIAAIFESDALATQGRRLKAARDRVEKLDRRMTSEHPEMKAAMRMRDREQERMQELLDKDIQALDGAVAAARERVRTLSATADVVSASTGPVQTEDRQLAQLRKDLEWAERRLALLLEAEQPVSTASPGRKPATTPQLPVVTITEEALPPNTPIRPDRQAIVLTAIGLGIGLGLLLVLMRGARGSSERHRY